jgi:hypothetical protein
MVLNLCVRAHFQNIFVRSCPEHYIIGESNNRFQAAVKHFFHLPSPNKVQIKAKIILFGSRLGKYNGYPRTKIKLLLAVSSLNLETLRANGLARG